MPPQPAAHEPSTSSVAPAPQQVQLMQQQHQMQLIQDTVIADETLVSIKSM
jgi:hypothetical protein